MSRLRCEASGDWGWPSIHAVQRVVLSTLVYPLVLGGAHPQVVDDFVRDLGREEERDEYLQVRRIGLKEFAFIGGPIQQALYFQARLRRDPTPARCVFVTWLGAAPILSYHVWIRAGLPVALARA